MHARPAGIAIASVIAVLAAAPAQAATLSVEKPCYAALDPAGDLTFVGSGYPPSSLILLSSGDVTVGSAVSDASGNFRQKYQIPGPPDTGKNAHEQQFTFAATDNVDSSITASTTFSTAHVFGDYSVVSGGSNPYKMRVRFKAFGFGAGLAAGTPAPPVYIHYVNPRGKVKRTISIGQGSGVCGSIRTSKVRRLFPFKPTRGKWTLQFDTRKTYKRGTSTSSFLFDRGLTLTLS